MIKLKTNNDKVFYIPSSWSEVTFKQWKDLIHSNNEMEMLSILSGLEIDIINRIKESDLIKLSVCISFVKHPLKIENYSAPGKIVINKNVSIPLITDIGEQSFGQKVYFHELLKSGSDNIIELLPELILTYGQPYIDKSDFDLNRLIELVPSFDNIFFVDLYATALNYIEQLNAIIEIEKEHLSTKPTNEQVAAGVNMFEEFGVMNTIKALANGNILNYEKVLKIEYNTVFNHMRMNKTESIFQENYRKVMEQKHKRK